MNSYFWVFSVLLLTVATVFVVMLPKRWERRAAPENNADWLRLRQRELLDSAPELREEAALRVIEDGFISDAPAVALPAHYSIKHQLLGVAALFILVAGLYVKLGSFEDVVITEALDGLESAGPADISALIERIGRRADVRPENADYSLLLGEYYLSTDEPLRALGYFDRLIEAGATSPEILGKAAQAEFLSADRQLSNLARSRAQQALTLDPMASAALATLGMAAFEAANFAAAIRYWETLRSLEPEGSPGHQMLGQVIERARSEIADPNTLAEAPVGLVVRATLADAFEVDPEATVYVLARPEQRQGGMPIAVVRRRAEEWPLVVPLDDGHSMAGQKLSNFNTVAIEVQVSVNGQPGRDNSIAWGVVNSATVGTSEPVAVVLEPTGFR